LQGDSFEDCAMTQELIEQSRRRPAFADQAFVAATLALAASVAVAFTIVSIGIARAAM
jgi:hypothetical protein